MMADLPRTVITLLETGRTHKKGNSIEYYWVRPPSTLSLTVGPKKDTELEEWCIDTFGPSISKDRPDGRWFCLSNKFYFVNQEDMAMFILRIS